MFQKLNSIFIILAMIFCNLPGNAQKKVTADSLAPKDLKTGSLILLVKVRDYETYLIKKYEKLFTKNYDGGFKIVPFNVLIDKTYPDLKTYKYVLVIAGGLTAEDFSGVSDRSNFFDKTDSSFLHTGSSLYIFDRTSNHKLYEAGADNVMKGSTRHLTGKYYIYEGAHPELVSFGILKEYVKVLNGDD